MTKILSEKEFIETMGSGMTDVTDTAKPIVDIWPYVKDLVLKNIVADHVLQNNLVESVYRNNSSTFEHILLPTSDENIFVVIIVDINKAAILGYYRLDLYSKYH